MPDDGVSRGGVDVVRLAAALPAGLMRRFEALLAEVYAAGWAAGRKETLRGVSAAVGLLPPPDPSSMPVRPRTVRDVAREEGLSLSDMMVATLRRFGTPMSPLDLRMMIQDRWRITVGSTSIHSALTYDSAGSGKGRFREGRLDGRLRIGLGEWDAPTAIGSIRSGE